MTIHVTCRWARRTLHLPFVSRSVNQNTNNPTGRPCDQPESNWLAAEWLDRYPARLVVAWPNEHPGARSTSQPGFTSLFTQPAALSALRLASDQALTAPRAWTVILINSTATSHPVWYSRHYTRYFDVFISYRRSFLIEQSSPARYVDFLIIH